MATTTTRNGVDVDRLVATISAVQDDPDIAKFTFHARSSWESVGATREVGAFDHAGDNERAADVVRADR